MKGAVRDATKRFAEIYFAADPELLLPKLDMIFRASRPFSLLRKLSKYL